MNVDLNSILNSNNDLLQTINHNQFLKEEFCGMLKNIENLIPKDCRKNFYQNLKTLKLNITDTTLTHKDTAGLYYASKNELCINKYILNSWNKNDKSPQNIENYQILSTTLYHELLHMASTTRIENPNYYINNGGFNHIVKDENNEFLYSEKLVGLTEGFTELLTLLAFEKNSMDTISTYYRQINFAAHLALLTDMETMKRAYFNNSLGIFEIDEKLKLLDGNSSHLDLFNSIEYDYHHGYNTTDDENKEFKENYIYSMLMNIELQLLELSNTKIKQMLKENPNMTEDEINEYWAKTAGTINFPEKLEIIGENPNNYYRIDQLRQLFMKFKEETLNRNNIKK